ncbi:MAG: hypothetical protein JSV13_05095 [Nitrospiraceae bacterium]|nr:MAG: hypothetical protein JSV13_05095 [Nitrospiraceae bacterium]
MGNSILVEENKDPSEGMKRNESKTDPLQTPQSFEGLDFLLLFVLIVMAALGVGALFFNL